jgi:cell filamentation protein
MGIDFYVYKGTSVLKNKLDIRSESQLQKAEAYITWMRFVEISLVKGNFYYQHLKDIHKHLFGDLYEWAGCEREIPMKKGEEVLGFMSVNYSFPSEIKRHANAAIKKFHSEKWSELDADEQALRLAKYTAALWQAHPFREGNTRTVTAFATEFAKSKGIVMNKKLLAKNSGYVRDCLVLASIEQYSEYEHLAEIFADSIKSNDSKIEAKERNETVYQTELGGKYFMEISADDLNRLDGLNFKQKINQTNQDKVLISFDKEEVEVFKSALEAPVQTEEIGLSMV